MEGRPENSILIKMKVGYIFLVVRFLVVLRVRFPGSYIPDRIRSGETQSVEFKNSSSSTPGNSIRQWTCKRI